MTTSTTNTLGNICSVYCTYRKQTIQKTQPKKRFLRTQPTFTSIALRACTGCVALAFHSGLQNLKKFLYFVNGADAHKRSCLALMPVASGPSEDTLERVSY